MTKLFMMCGLPASGKTTQAKIIAKNENAVIYSSDKMREDMNFSNSNSEHNDILFRELHNCVVADLRKGRNVIFDATNISWKKRRAFLDRLKPIDCEKIAVFKATPYFVCLERNLLRENPVPPEVIKRMYRNFYVPQLYEGFDAVDIRRDTGGMTFNTFNLFYVGQALVNIEQETPYHSLTIGEHCIKCANILEELYHQCELNMSFSDMESILTAGFLHDIGKQFTKEYNYEKGHCTYYQHHLVSAYDSIFYTIAQDAKNPLLIANYIQWHMQFFFLRSEKSYDKFKNLVGEEFYNNLMLLHVADKLAK